MEKKDHIINILEKFRVSISGLFETKEDLKVFKKKWFLTFKSKFERDFLKQLIPELEKLEDESNQKLKTLLNKESTKFLKSLNK